MKKITIEHLYPEVANLYGDSYNTVFLSKCTNATVIETHLKEKPVFTEEDISLVYMGCTTEKGQELIRDALSPYVADILAAIDRGQCILVTGNSMEIFWEYIETDQGEHIPMLGLFPYYATRRLMDRYNALFLGQFDGNEVIGFKSQFGHSYRIQGRELPDGAEELFAVTRGAGMNPDSKGEGIRLKNFWGTYVEGPLLVMNPPLTRYLQQIMGIENPGIIFEQAAMDVYDTRRKEFAQPDRGFIY